MLVGVNDDRCDNCGRRHPGMWGFAGVLRGLGDDLGFVRFVMAACVLFYVISLVRSGDQVGTSGLFRFLSPNFYVLIFFGASGAGPVFGLGRWWTLLSAGWLHGSLLHIVMNMIGLRQLAPLTAELYGPGRMVIIYTIGGIAGFALSTLAYVFIPPLPFLAGGAVTVGASAPLAGLLGALMYYRRRSGSSAIGQYAVSNVVSMAALGLMVPGIDNYAHMGGFAGGYLAARFLDPLKPERVDHLLVAIACLALSVLAVIASLIHGQRYVVQ